MTQADGRRNRRTSDRGPAPALLLASVLALAFLLLPLLSLLVGAPWGAMTEVLRTTVVVEAAILSAATSVVAALLAAMLGVPLAWVLARGQLPATRIWRALVTLPMVLPPVVGGVALLQAFGRRGLVGGYVFEFSGQAITFSPVAVVLANTFVALPFVVVTVEGAFTNLDPRYEQVAATLGAGKMRIFALIALPSVRPSLRAGLVLAWARALGEFGATMTFAGNIPNRTQTLPLAVSVAQDSGDRETALAISVLMVVVSFSVLLMLREHWWHGRRATGGRGTRGT